MENAKHSGRIWALAVALGVGIAVANTPAVALAKPGDSGTGSSPGGSSPSSSSRDTGSTSSNTPSAKTSPDSRHKRPLNPAGTVSNSGGPQTSTTTGSSDGATTALTPSTPETPDSDARQRGRPTSRPGLGDMSAKTSPKLAANPTPAENALDAIGVVASGAPSFASTTPAAAVSPVAAITAAPMASSPVSAAIATPHSTAATVVAPADPVSRLVSTLINAVLSPFANNAPGAPVGAPGMWTMLAFARREFGPGSSTPSTIVDPLAGQVTNGLVTNTVASAPTVASPVTDPDFISSTMNFFGLFSITSAADPDDNHFVAVVFTTPFFTDVLTSGADPEDNLGFGAASTGVAGQTVNTFISPFLTFSLGIPITDPFAEFFTALIQQGII